MGCLTPHMTIKQQKLSPDWHIAWANIKHKHLSNTVRWTWHTLAQGVVPTIERSKKINLQATSTCMSCMKRDTFLHRITFCTEAKDIWRWTRARLVLAQRTDLRHTTSHWLIFPTFLLWLRTKHDATIWILAHMAHHTIKLTNPCQLQITSTS